MQRLRRARHLVALLEVLAGIGKRRCGSLGMVIVQVLAGMHCRRRDCHRLRADL